MSATHLAPALRRHRSALVLRWARQFAINRQAAGRPAVTIDAKLLAALFDEVVSLLGANAVEHIPLRRHAEAFAELAVFPDNVAVCIDAFQAGTQVLGAFIVENAGPVALWSTSSRNRYLGELDAVFHILVHREIEALCEMCLSRGPARPVTIAPTLLSTPSPVVTPPAPGVFLRN